MRYETPEMFLVISDKEDIITTSDTLVDTGGPGGNEGGSTLPFDPAIAPIK